jgi:hypothetical protein
MDNHLTDDDLVLHYYGELGDADEARASSHLAQCSVCHAGYLRLQRVLAAVHEGVVATPDLPAAFERTVWARLEPNLEPARGGWLSWFVLSPARLAWVASIAVLVAGAFFAGRFFPRQPDAAPAQNAGQVLERILLVDLGDHLDRSQMVLVELVSAGDSGEVDISGERARAEQLVAANRLYRQTALQTGDAGIVALLDELERVLVDVAASPEQLSALELAEVRRRIDSHGLLFRVRVLSSEVRERQRSAVRQRTGPGSVL